MSYPFKEYCRCHSGWTGTHCEIACSLDCNQGDCLHHMSYPFKEYCRCHSGWTGTHCETGNGCHSNPCHNGGKCEHTFHAPYFRCECRNNAFGQTCEELVVTTGQSAENMLTHPATKLTASTKLSTTTEKVTQTTVSMTSLPNTVQMSTKGFPIVNHTCSKLNTVLGVAEKVMQTNPSVSECTSGSHTPPEAYVLAHCDVGPTSTWKQGVKVMEWCDRLPSYTPIAAFDNGVFRPDTCFSGVFISCLRNETGIKMILQKCDENPDIHHVTGGPLSSNPFSYFTIQ